MVDVVFKTATTSGTYVCSFPSFQRSSPVTLYVYGEFDGASVDVSISPDGANWFPAQYNDGGDATIINSNLVVSDDKGAIIVGTFSFLKLVISNVGGATSLNAVVM